MGSPYLQHFYGPKIDIQNSFPPVVAESIWFCILFGCLSYHAYRLSHIVTLGPSLYLFVTFFLFFLSLLTFFSTINAARTFFREFISIFDFGFLFSFVFFLLYSMWPCGSYTAFGFGHCSVSVCW